MQTKKIPDLPSSDDKTFWEEGAEHFISKYVPNPTCSTHGRNNWTEHVGYIDNHDNTASCKYCDWGFLIPGYMRIHNERVFDLRKA